MGNSQNHEHSTQINGSHRYKIIQLKLGYKKKIGVAKKKESKLTSLIFKQQLAKYFLDYLQHFISLWLYF